MSWTYKTELDWEQGNRAVARMDGSPDLPVMPPVHFGGEAGHWTPEDLLLSAAESCLLMTTLFFVHKMGIEMTGYTSRAEAGMERRDGALHFTHIRIVIEATVSKPEGKEQLETAVREAEQVCPVGTAIAVPISVDVDVEVATDPG